MVTIQKPVVSTEVGAAEFAAGVVYLHDFELDGDEDFSLGQRIEVLDGGGRHHAATVVERVPPRWKLRIQPRSQTTDFAPDNFGQFARL